VTLIEVAPQGLLTVEAVKSRGRGCAGLALLGPAFVASVAYVDPGNFATNFAAGAEHGHELVWVVVMANLMAILVQYLTSKTGLATGQSLPELCRERYGRRMNFVLWLQAEIVAMATDLAEFVGAALGFGVALIASGLASSSVSTYAGQIVMAGFMNWRIPLFARRALTMMPALIVIRLAVNTTQALIYSQIVLSFGIPFALIPLLLITRTRDTMTDMANRRLTSALMLLITVVITTLNLYLLYDTLTGLV
jgi:manganese transport protein